MEDKNGRSAALKPTTKRDEDSKENKADGLESMIREIQEQPEPEDVEGVLYGANGARLEYIDGDLIQIHRDPDGKDICTVIQRGVHSIEQAIDHLHEWLRTCDPADPFRPIMLGRMEALTWCVGEELGNLATVDGRDVN